MEDDQRSYIGQYPALCSYFKYYIEVVKFTMWVGYMENICLPLAVEELAVRVIGTAICNLWTFSC